MKTLRGLLLIFVLALLTIPLAGDAEAQTRREAVQTYNRGFDLAKEGEYDKAISAYLQTISISEKVGKKANDIKKKAQNKLPSMYFRKAAAVYKEFKKSQSLEKLDQTIQAFQEAKEAARKYKSKEILTRTEKIIPQLYYSKSLVQFQSNKYMDALNTLNKAIKLNPNYALAYYQKGIVVKNMSDDSLQAAIDYFDKSVKVAKKNNNKQVARKARNAARDWLVYQGSQHIKDKDYKDAVDLLRRSLEYNSKSPDAYFRLAEAYNKQALWDKAIEAANKGLQYEKGGKTDRAKIYFEKAVALKNQGNKSAACDAFEQAAYGSFKAPAEHQMEYELECPGFDKEKASSQ